MDKKRPQFPFRLPFVLTRKNLRQVSTDESQLGAQKSGVKLDIILRSLRGPRWSARNDKITTKTKAWAAVFALVIVAILCYVPLSKRGFRAAGRGVETAAKGAGNAISKDASAAGNWLSDKADHGDEASNDLSEKVADALKSDTRISISELSVETVRNVVTLRGTIENEDQNQRAEHIARTAAGSDYQIEDQLKVD